MPRFSCYARGALVVLSFTAGINVAVTGCSRAGWTPGRDRASGDATVVRVIDGDTVVLRLRGRDEPVRLLGVDTPETKDPRRPVQCFGKEASAHTAHLLPAGTRVQVARDVEPRDRYGRLLLYVWRARDHLFVNLQLAADGYADTLTYPPNVAHAGELTEAVARARQVGRGLWGRCDGPDQPVDPRPGGP